jgi:CheY-like chemotaxis protein
MYMQDSPVILKMIVRQLQARGGLIVDTACNGEEGLEKMKANQYVFVLTDLEMPKVILAPDLSCIPP